MKQIVPAVYKCRTHDRELTEDVVAKVASTPQKLSGTGFRFSGRRAPQPFKVVVRCPDGDGHDLVFSGTYGG
jgi:hypothetical protein